MMIEMPSHQQHKGKKKKNRQYDHIPHDGGSFEDFDNYHDEDDDDDRDEYVSTSVLRSDYTRPRDYRTRRILENAKWMLVGGVAAAIVVVMMMAMSASSSSGGSGVTLPPVVAGHNDNEPKAVWDESAGQEIERKPIPEAEKEDQPPKQDSSTQGGGNWFENDPAADNTEATPPSPDDNNDDRTVDIIQPDDTTSNSAAAALDGLNQHDKPEEDSSTQGGGNWFENDPAGDSNQSPQPPVDNNNSNSTSASNIDQEETSAPSGAPVAQDNNNNDEDEDTSAGGTEEEEDSSTSGGGDWFENDPADNTNQAPPSAETDPPKDESLAPPDHNDNSDAPGSIDMTPPEETATTETAVPSAFTPRDTVPYQYQRRRGVPVSLHQQSALAQKWGTWTFVDSKVTTRPTYDYCGAYKHRDIPLDKFPKHAWQTDPAYLKDFLSEGKALVMRAMEVHLAEYGFGPDDLPAESFEDRRDKSPFKLEILDEFVDDEGTRRRLSTGVNEYAGWTTKKSFHGLVRRLLHAVVSRDSFNVVLGGHSAAAGHGNHFQQSYALQIQRVLEPVFARLGVKHYSRNTGMGGLGTIQSAMGAQDIYGRDVDILIWDSAMTESSESPDFDMFARQGILGSDRAPIVWAGSDKEHVYPTLQKAADVDYMMYGTGLGPIPSVTDPTTVDQIPWAARYLKCDTDWAGLCKENRYNGTCWIERPDHFVPPTTQKEVPGGRASWHDGNRMHQLYGRTMSFTVLRALYEAIEVWDKQPGKKLQDDQWHVSLYYENIQNKLANLDPSIGTCYGVEDRLPTEFCKLPFQARTEFTPRANPAETSLRSIMKPAGADQIVPQPKLNVYNAPDVNNPVLGVPDGEVDYLAIIENGKDFLRFEAPATPLGGTDSNNRLIELTVDDNGEEIVPGLGWGVNTKTSPHLCNGTYDSFCGRSEDQQCLLYAHNDFRGGLSFDSLSGWGIFTLKDLKEGMIYVKMDSWRKAKDNPVTEGWTAENNGTRTRALSTSPRMDGGGLRRRLKKDENSEFCPDFMLEFAFGDTLIRLNSEEILGARHSLVQRVVQVWDVLNDRDFTKGETVDIELGIRIRGCSRDHVFWVTHLYWA